MSEQEELHKTWNCMSYKDKSALSFVYAHCKSKKFSSRNFAEQSQKAGKK